MSYPREMLEREALLLIRDLPQGASPMTDPLSKLPGLLERATPGPWFVHDFRGVSSNPSVHDITVSCDTPATLTVCSMGNALTAKEKEALANAELIALAPGLAKLCLEQQSTIERMREALEAMCAGSEMLARHYKIDLCNDVENGSAYHKARAALSTKEGEKR